MLLARAMLLSGKTRGVMAATMVTFVVMRRSPAAGSGKPPSPGGTPLNMPEGQEYRGDHARCLGHEFVTEAKHGDDQSWFLGIVFQFLPQTCYMDVNRPREGLGAIGPHFLE